MNGQSGSCAPASFMFRMAALSIAIFSRTYSDISVGFNSFKIGLFPENKSYKLQENLTVQFLEKQHDNFFVII